MKTISPATRKKQIGSSLLDRARQQSEAKFWTPAKKGDGIEGKVVKIVRDAGKFHSTFYHVNTEDGVQIIAGGATVLGQSLSDQQLEVGDSVGVLYLGEATSQAGRVFKNWSVVAEKANKPSSDGNPPSDDQIPF